MTDQIKLVTNANGLSFGVTIVREGELYGRNFVLTHDSSDPLVEFYDLRYPFALLKPDADTSGQFVSRYYLKTLLEHGDAGLDLDGGVRDWKIDAAAMAEVIDWLRTK
jgi:hypothetical protein